MSEADKRLSALSLIDQASSDSTETVTPSAIPKAHSVGNESTTLPSDTSSPPTSLAPLKRKKKKIVVKQDDLKSLEWAKKGATRDHAGCINLQFKRAATLGDAVAMFNYGTALLHGIGVDADETMALLWLTRATNASKEAAQKKTPPPSQDPIVHLPRSTDTDIRPSPLITENSSEVSLYTISSTKVYKRFDAIQSADATHTVKEALEPVIPVRPLICDMFDDDDTCSESFDPLQNLILTPSYRVTLRQKHSSPSIPITGDSGINSTSSPSAETAFLKPNPTHRQYRVALNLGSINSTSSSSTETAFPNSDPSHRQYRHIDT
ncbi:hypothetical protein BC829DRAFT_439371 [Chytridium lagenaria]|nr:hypothetical protein BC829DRAFT_439371 [Chytridium lagenaria]